MKIVDIIHELAKLGKESEWVEFKVNFADHETIGKNISALSNAACLHGLKKGYLIWGIHDGTHDVVGTDFSPSREKQGNEDLESWLARLLNPRIDFVVHEAQVDSKRVVVFEIDASYDQPVEFSGQAYIRIGSYTKPLRIFPEKQRKIWNRTEDLAFEQRLVMTDVSGNTVLSLIDHEGYFKLTGRPLPFTETAILDVLASEDIIHKTEDRFSITYLGAILFARDLNEFDKVRGKAIRVISYEGQDRLHSNGDQQGSLGYAIAFDKLINFITARVPTKEVFRGGLRTNVTWFPEIAIRELVANALIHQDLSIGGAAPMIEIFSDRIEITNPGQPLIPTLRFIDHTPISRNERVVSLMRRIGICEHRGSGIDRVIKAIEDQYLRATLYSPRPLSKMDRADRIRACYQHCCLRFESNEVMTNSSFRGRFDIDQKNQAVASRIIRDTIEQDLVMEKDPNNKSKKMACYIPSWA